MVPSGFILWDTMQPPGLRPGVCSSASKETEQRNLCWRESQVCGQQRVPSSCWARASSPLIFLPPVGPRSCCQPYHEAIFLTQLLLPEQGAVTTQVQGPLPSQRLLWKHMVWRRHLNVSIGYKVKALDQISHPWSIRASGSACCQPKHFRHL